MEPIVATVRIERERVEAPDFYPFAIPAVRALLERGSLDLHPQVTFLVGENGSGKSTLIEGLAISAGFNAEGGTRNFGFDTRASHSPLHEVLRLVRRTRPLRHGFFLRAESLFNVATEIERLDKGGGGPRVIDSYGGVDLHEQSHGEAFLAVIQHGFRRGGFYVLDEPEAALSPQRQLALMALMHGLTEVDADDRDGPAQFVIATHSPILMAFPHARIYEVGDRGLEEIAFEDTEHVRITRGFLNAPEVYLRALFAPGELQGP